ncbi:medium-chain acyl-CoA ligase ACSF2, mitochondrial-like [Euwallacea similis]|uniref:medium-chain acyl-CoA ligase ACSF2, mitochondrial-like n=1 Tax=Euwallacea similis TaxID=1736056 RepID=UPI00344D7E99
MIKLNPKHYLCLLKRRAYTTLSYIHNPGTEPLRPLTIGKLLERTAQKYGDRSAIISPSQNQSFTFEEVLQRADRLAAALYGLGLQKGDRVGIWAQNISEWYITHMGVARGGFVLVNINPAYQLQELQSCINAVGVKALVCMSKTRNHDYYSNLTQISPEIATCSPGKLTCAAMPSLSSIIMTGEDSSNQRGTFCFNDVLNLASENAVREISKIQSYIDPDDLGHLQFTSGTTGTPKSPMESHFQIVNNAYFIGKRNELDQKHHVVCLMAPFFHGIGTVITLVSALNHAASLVIPSSGYDPDRALDAIRDEKCTVIIGTPTMYVDLVNRQKSRTESINPEIAVTGGACCSPHLFKEMKEVLNLKKVKSVYGLTEVTAVAFQSLYDDNEHQSTSTVGYVGDHLEVKVIDAEGRIVPRGTPGELCIRGYSTTLGYWKDEEKTKALVGADKWLRTGDQFVIDDNGYGRVVGRLKEMIIRGGENIFPAEIEDYLNTHPSVLETHVVGIPHERLGEEVCACVRIKPNESFTLDEVKSYCKGNIAHFKIPSKLRIVKAFPKTISGKIQKYKLVESICKEIQ